MILALLAVGSLIWYFVTVRPTGDLQLIGTVDANEVEVSARIPGRIQTLTVKEGDTVQAGQLIAVIQSDDLEAALHAAEATAASQRSKLNGTVETERQNSGETTSATVSAEAQVRVAEASLAQTKAQLAHQQADHEGNVHLWGISGVQKEAVLAGRRTVVTVEEIVERFEPRMGSVVLPSWVIGAVAVVPGGAHPSYAAGYSVRDNDFYKRWDSISREREGFLAWMAENVTGRKTAASVAEQRS